MSTDPIDLGVAQGALNDAAGKSSALWTTFITFEVYLLIAFGSVTHRDLLLETPVHLPLLSVDLPLVGFFVVAPILLVIFHFYAALQITALASKAALYNALLASQVPLSSDRQHLRQRLDPFIVVQFLAGPTEHRATAMGISFKLVTWLTLIGAPAAIILFAQVVFLPFHLWWVVWFYRVVLAIDIAIGWLLWRGIRNIAADPDDGSAGRFWTIAGASCTIVLLLFSTTVATYPGEWTNENIRSFAIIPTTFLPKWSNRRDWTSLHDLMFLGPINQVTGKPESLFSSRLVLANQSFIDSDKLSSLEVSRRFRGRDLRGAIFIGADLRKVDFTGSNLVDADFSSAKLQQAQFDCASLGYRDPKGLFEEEKEVCSDLRAAEFRYAELTGALFKGVNLQGADFVYATLIGAKFVLAHAQGASFNRINAQGARFDGNFSGASFFSANLTGADLTGGDFRAVRFDESKLVGASIGNNNTFNASHFSQVSAYRLYAEDDNYKLKNLSFDGFKMDKTLWTVDSGYSDFKRFSEKLRSDIDADEKIKTSVLNRMSVLKPDLNPDALSWVETHSTPLSAKFKAATIPQDRYASELSHEIYFLICYDSSAQYIARGMLRSGILELTNPDIPQLVSELRNSKGKHGEGPCSGERALPEELISAIESLPKQKK
jgi:uncharacterized protein YjbI with pentapeptide repeats